MGDLFAEGGREVASHLIDLAIARGTRYAYNGAAGAAPYVASYIMSRNDKRRRVEDSGMSGISSSSTGGSVEYTMPANEDLLTVSTRKRVKAKSGRHMVIQDGKGWNPYIKDTRPYIQKIMNPLYTIMGHEFKSASIVADVAQGFGYHVTEKISNIEKFFDMPNSYGIKGTDASNTAAGLGFPWNDYHNLNTAVYDPAKLHCKRIQHRMLIKNPTNHTAIIFLSEWVAKRDSNDGQSVQNLFVDEIEMNNLNTTALAALSTVNPFAISNCVTTSGQGGDYGRGIGGPRSPIYDYWNRSKTSKIILPPGQFVEYMWYGNFRSMKRAILTNMQELGITNVKGVTKTLTLRVMGQMVDEASTHRIGPGDIKITYEMESAVAVYGGYKSYTPQVMRQHNSLDVENGYWPIIATADQRKINPTTNAGVGYQTDK